MNVFLQNTSILSSLVTLLFELFIVIYTGFTLWARGGLAWRLWLTKTVIQHSSSEQPEPPYSLITYYLQSIQTVAIIVFVTASVLSVLCLVGCLVAIVQSKKFFVVYLIGIVIALLPLSTVTLLLVWGRDNVTVQGEGYVRSFIWKHYPFGGGPSNMNPYRIIRQVTFQEAEAACCGASNSTNVAWHKVNKGWPDPPSKHYKISVYRYLLSRTCCRLQVMDKRNEFLRHKYLKCSSSSGVLRENPTIGCYIMLWKNLDSVYSLLIFLMLLMSMSIVLLTIVTIYNFRYLYEIDPLDLAE